MLTLQPQNSFTIVRQIADHTDVDTLYVRAVIRNAYSDVIIATLDLTDKGAQRFKKDWQVSPDPSGQGFYISMITSVYVDSNYTTKSPNYGDEENTYLVQERVLGSLKSGSGVTMRQVREVMEDVIGKIKFPEPEKIEFPEPEKIEFPKQEKDARIVKVLSILSDIKFGIGKIPIDIIDLTPILTSIKKLDDKDIDLSEVVSAIEKISSDFKKDNEKTQLLIKKVVEQLPVLIEGSVKDLHVSLPLKIESEKREEKPKKEFNIKDLAR